MNTSAPISVDKFGRTYTWQHGVRRITKQDVGVLLIILLVGGVLRFVYPEVIDWSNDHSDIALLAQQFAYGKGIPLTGQPSSAVIPHSPVYIYPSIIPFSITDNPVLASTVSAFLNLIGVAIIWLIGLRYFGRIVAGVAGIAYAVNPWVLGYSRSIWSGDHRAMFVSLGVLLGLLGFLEGKRWAQVLCLPVLLVGIQTHYAGYTLLPLYLLFLWIGRGKVNWKTMASSFVLGILVLLPYVSGILITLLGETLSATTIRPQPRDFSLREIAKPYGHLFWLTTGMGTELYSARENAAELRAQAMFPTILWTVQGVAAFLGLVSLWKHYAREVAAVLSVWALLTVVVFTWPIIGVYPHYFIPVIPALALLIGIGVAWLIKASTRLSKVLGVSIAGMYGVIFVSQAMFWLVSLAYLDTHFTPSQFGFGTPIHYLMDVRNELKQHKNIVFITNRDWLDFSRTGSRVFAPFLRSTTTCLRDVKIGGDYAVIPNEPFAAVFAPRTPADALLSALYRSDNSTVVPLRSGEGVYTINRIERLPEWSKSIMTPVQPVTFSNGAQLIGYSSTSSQLTLQWALPQAVEDNSMYSVKLFDAENQLLSEGEAEFWPGRNWCTGDQLFTWLDIDIPEQATLLQVTLASSALEPSAAESGALAAQNGVKATIQLHEK
ncbi:MAG: glycosyltransferase family 39 protein [Caldilineaceae bacterium]|jgi:hypothetical protein|nr:glycosyltransferase family 39 protein [Caldilineaceae bacterium]